VSVNGSAVHLLRHYAILPPKGLEPRGGLPAGRLRQVFDYMHAQLGDELSLRQLADLVQLSPYHFAALFKQRTGCAPYQYFLRRRIAHAQHLLAETRISLAAKHSLPVTGQLDDATRRALQLPLPGGGGVGTGGG
jgi:AraC family transcriptional regulator